MHFVLWANCMETLHTPMLCVCVLRKLLLVNKWFVCLGSVIGRPVGRCVFSFCCFFLHVVANFQPLGLPFEVDVGQVSDSPTIPTKGGDAKGMNIRKENDTTIGHVRRTSTSLFSLADPFFERKFSQHDLLCVAVSEYDFFYCKNRTNPLCGIHGMMA